MISPAKFSEPFKPLNFKKLIAIGLFISLGLPIIGSAISFIFLSDWRGPHEPFHAVIEGIGGFIALILSGILLPPLNIIKTIKLNVSGWHAL
jgi:hypothetical protein